jgi:hypothetical protein
MRIPRPLPLVCTTMLALGACGQDRNPPAPTVSTAPPASTATTASSEMAWARAALERNPNLEVLAADTAAGVFTVRDRASGEIETVKAGELAAMPVAPLSAAVAEPPLPATAAGESVPAAEPATTVAQVSAENATATPTLDYKVERSGGQVRVSGPGLSIVSAGTTAAATGKADDGPKTVDPIICEGPRMMQLNDRHIVVDGDAITARGGCQLHITNSRIVATGTGVVIRDATVHITNSEIEGARASFDAGPGAKVFLQGATLKGVTRRDERAEVQEQGGNSWQ